MALTELKYEEAGKHPVLENDVEGKASLNERYYYRLAQRKEGAFVYFVLIEHIIIIRIHDREIDGRIPSTGKPTTRLDC